MLVPYTAKAYALSMQDEATVLPALVPQAVLVSNQFQCAILVQGTIVQSLIVVDDNDLCDE